jgi:hypothetical protein
MFKKSLIIFSVLFISSLWANAHKFYTSLTQVEYNAKANSAEVIMNLFVDDLEGALSNHHKRTVKSTDNDFKALLYKYLDNKFQVQDIKNQALKNEYVGMEFKRDMVSVYLEIKLGEGLNQVNLKQVSLLEAYKDQTNIVNLRDGKNKTSLVFRAGTPDIQTVNFRL